MWPYGFSTIYRYGTKVYNFTPLGFPSFYPHDIILSSKNRFLFLHIFTGANSFAFYAVPIFKQTFAGMNPHGAAIAVGFVQLLAAMLSGLLIDTVGRIPLLIISSVFMSLALASFGSYAYYDHESKILEGNTDWIPLLCVLVFTIAFSLGKFCQCACLSFSCRVENGLFLSEIKDFIEISSADRDIDRVYVFDYKLICFAFT